MKHGRETFGVVKHDPAWKELKHTLSNPKVSPSARIHALYTFLKSKNFTREAEIEVAKYLYYLSNHKKYEHRRKITHKFPKKEDLDIDI